MSESTGGEYIEAVVTLPIHGTYCFKVPERLRGRVRIGTGLIVPFRSRRVSAFVVEMDACPPDHVDEIREIEDLLAPDPFFGPDHLKLYKFMSDYYLVPIGEALRTAMPPGILQATRKIVQITSEGREVADAANLKTSFRDVLRELARGPISGMLLQALQKRIRGAGPKTMETLECRGYIISSTQLSKQTARPRYLNLYAPVDGLDLSEALPRLSRAPVRRKVLDHLVQIGAPASKTEIAEALGFGVDSHLRALASSGIISKKEVEVFRIRRCQIDSSIPEKLTDDQENALCKISEAMDKSSFQPFLLHGVTGSGKTEVYIRLVKKALEEGKTAIVLVPEIALTPQLLGRFVGRLGHMVYDCHSAMSTGERYDLWRRVRKGEIKVVVGARSALFSPLENLGLLVVDEEHDSSYKQSEGLSYNARDLAMYMGKNVSCPVVLGSATPSLESYHAAAEGRYAKVSLPSRVRERPLPPVELVDLRPLMEEKKPGTNAADKKDDLPHARMIFSEPLALALKETVQAGEQSILFLNRRGYSTQIFCLICGAHASCPNCDVSLTYHLDQRIVACHYCDYESPPPKTCRICGGHRMYFAGLGTEQVESALGELLPNARVIRMDRDTVRKKHGHEKILSAFRKHEYDILLGTQMVAKGHDFPDVTLVGIIRADTSLSIPDFRSAERTFQLITQVAGRAGRDEKAGRIIVQTFNPGHYAIECARQHDFVDFFHREIKRRKELDYPPFARLALVRISGMNRDEAYRAARDVAQVARVSAKKLDLPAENVLGPARSALARIKNRYRFQILLKGRTPKEVRTMAYQCMIFGEKHTPSGVKMRIDIDPQNV
jgi:primosomal protein N' (replication factor Y) (superfamily II helicase)